MRILSKCNLCPHCCGVDRHAGELGRCGMGDQIKLARAALHMWEEPCLVGRHGSGTVFFSGCSLKCVFCQNYQISTLGYGRIISEKELAQYFLELQKQGAANINLVTPTHFVPHIIYALEQAKNLGLNIPIVYNSSGYENTDTIEMLRGYVDIFLPDFKYFSYELATTYSYAPLYRLHALSTISKMLSLAGEATFNASGIMQKGVLVRHMLLPGHLEDSKKVLNELHHNFGNDLYVSLMSQYTPMPQNNTFRHLDHRVKKSDYEKLIAYALDLGFTHGFVQEGKSASHSFIPDFFDQGINLSEIK